MRMHPWLVGSSMRVADHRIESFPFRVLLDRGGHTAPINDCFSGLRCGQDVPEETKEGVRSSGIGRGKRRVIHSRRHSRRSATPHPFLLFEKRSLCVNGRCLEAFTPLLSFPYQ